MLPAQRSGDREHTRLLCWLILGIAACGTRGSDAFSLPPALYGGHSKLRQLYADSSKASSAHLLAPPPRGGDGGRTLLRRFPLLRAKLTRQHDFGIDPNKVGMRFVWVGMRFCLVLVL